jgi:hypothetical protein
VPAAAREWAAAAAAAAPHSPPPSSDNTNLKLMDLDSGDDGQNPFAFAATLTLC